MRITIRIVVIAVFLASSAGPTIAQDISVQLVAQGFSQPVLVTSPPGDARLFVLDQPGIIWIIDDGVVQPQPFLDLRDRVGFGGERGLLGLAFHPGYAENRRFFVNYTDRDGDTQIVEYRASSDPGLADPGSAAPILSVEQPAGNHNGGWIAFGPDGYFYIGTGDGGGANDAYGFSQNLDSLLAKILRIDVDGGRPYAIPPGNPFADGGGAPEAFLVGLRNPWRAAFDGDRLFIADVGQGAWEEISVVSIAEAGANLGWSVMEGAHCFRPRNCDPTGLVPPVYEYSHNVGCSITGGYVYRGSAIPDLTGHYFFSDYCEGFLRSFRLVDGQPTDITSWQGGDIGRVTSFGVDAAGELYITALDGRVFKIVPP